MSPSILQEQASNTIPVNLIGLGDEGRHGLTAIDIAETVWAITKYVYTDDELISIHRQIANLENSSEDRSTDLSTTYSIDNAMSPAQIAHGATRASNDMQEDLDAEEVASSGACHHLMRKAGLLISDDIDFGSIMENDFALLERPLLQLFTNGGSLSDLAYLHFPANQMPNDTTMHVASTIEQVCRSVMEDWNTPLVEHNFISESALTRISQWSKMPKQAASMCLGDIAMQQAKERPSQVFVEAWDGNLTFRELHDLSARVAEMLLKAGVKSEDRVLFCMKKSKWAVVAILGIMLAGGMCVPIDINAPQKRIETLIQQTQSRHAVVDQSTSSLYQDVAVQAFYITEDLPAGTPSKLPQLSANAGAFVYFTSGSTGTPKGVIQQHGALCAKLLELSKAYSITHRSRVFQYANHVFDPSIGDIFSAMLKGACLCIPSEEQRIGDLSNAIAAFRATHASLTNTVIAQIHPEKVPTLQHLFVGGEPLDRTQLSRWADRLNLNTIYGTTESLIYDSVGPCGQSTYQHKNLGREFGTCLWVVDAKDYEKLKPVGALGEIIIEGPLLAQGYLNDPIKTNSQFVCAPRWLKELRNGEADCCYKTGDTGFHNADGSVTFVGRADTQVKIRGQRIELGEVEHSFKLANPSMDQVVVEAVTIAHRKDAKLLAAFIPSSQPTADSALDPTMLDLDTVLKRVLEGTRDRLRELLPQYMVPTLFVPVSTMPLTPSGKLDRKILRDWVANADAIQIKQYQLASSTIRLPETASEICLQSAWAQLLHVPASTIGADDHFFSIGGDSVLAMQLAEILREHGQVLTVAEIFRLPRLCDMATRMTMKQPKTASMASTSQFGLIQDSCNVDQCIRQAADLCQIDVDQIEDVYPTYPMQEALMAISARRAGAYHHRVTLAVPSSLDVQRFQLAWQTVVAAQPILRTRIVLVPTAGSIQVVSNMQIKWRTGCSVQKYMQQDRDSAMTYGSELCRFAIISHGDGSTFLWTIHHALYDGWTEPRILDAVWRAYEGLEMKLTTTYTPFVHHVRSLDFQEADQFWREQFPAVNENYPSLPSPTYLPEPRQRLSLAMRLRPRANAATTIASVIQTAWALVVSQYTNSDDISFGLLLSGRDAPVEGIIKIMGPTIASVPFFERLDRSKSIQEMLLGVQGHIADIRRFQHVGLQRIRRLSPEAQAAVDFQNLLIVHPTDDAEFVSTFDKLGVQLIDQKDTDFMDTALTIDCAIGSEMVHVTAQYDESVVSKDHVQRALHTLEHISTLLVTEPETTLLQDLDLISRKDLEQLQNWNAEVPDTLEATLHGLVEAQVMSRPNEIAVHSGSNGDWTYAELDSMADAVAQHLVTVARVSLETRVMLSFAKSPWAIVAMLAILKCGGACVSINPEHPTERLVEISDDVEATLLLCDDSSSSTPFAAHFQHVVVVNMPLLTRLREQDSGERPSPEVQPSNAAFIVFTSGSTGKPKGSLLEHQSLATSLMQNGKRMHMQPETRTLQFAAYTFDFHIHEIFATLIHGGCVCVISEEERTSHLSSAIKENRVNWLMLTSTVAGLIRPVDVPEVQTLVLGGEPVSRRVVEEWTPYANVIGTYGPSECSVAASFKALDAETDPRNIGVAVGCRLWIAEPGRPQLDKLTPIGRIGELLIEGPIVGRHYVNRPEATAKAFIRDPVWAQNSNSKEPRRVYRTGDLAKFNDDGTITFYGRADTQVKLRGQRIELGEIEHHLKKAQPNFSQVAVEVVSIPQQDNKTLAAFVSYSQRPGRTLPEQRGNFMSIDQALKEDLIEVRRVLTERLPMYMVPTLLFPLHQMPQSTSAKLDRKTLRQWFAALDSEAISEYYVSKNLVRRQPTTDKEILLQSLWAKLLKVSQDTIGADDNFFEVGGDSVMAMELIVALRDLGNKLNVTQIFQNPRLCDMANTCEIDQTIMCCEDVKSFELLPYQAHIDKVVSTTAQACDVSPESIQDIYPTTPMQEALMAISAHRDGAYHFQEVFRVSTVSSFNVVRFQQAWEVFVSAETIFRSRITVIQDIGSVQVVLKPSPIEWRASQSLRQYLKQDRDMPMSYGAELTRFAFVRDGAELYFVLTAHHAIYDGWSLPLIFEKITALYQSQELSMQEPAPYSNFVRHLRAIDSAEEISFWEGQFPAAVETYPRIQPGYAPRPRQSKSFTVKYERPTGSATTTSTILQAAWALVSSQRAGVKEETIFGLTLCGRDSPMAGITTMVGPAMTTVPLRICIDYTKTVAGFLRDVQDQVARVRPFQHTGLQRIRQINARTRTAAEFQNLLVIHPSQDSASALQSIGLQGVQHQQDDFLDLALTLDCTIESDSVHVVFQYDNHVVPDRDVEHLFSQFEHITTTLLTSHTDALMSDAEFLSPDDVKALHQFNQKEFEVVENTVHALVEVQAALRPNAVAISGFDGDITYGKFDGMATTLAAHLSELGIKTERKVILCFTKSAWPIVAMYAVLKAGGVCVSVDSNHPTTRILEICEDVNATVVLCDNHNVARFSNCIQHVFAVDSSLFDQLPPRRDWIQPTVLPTDASFVVYTSGSTGKPKGCVLEHRSACTSQVINSRVMAIGPDTRALQFASFTFDASICEIFAPLCHGGCVCVISDEERVNDLAKAINDRKADWMMLTPTVAQLFGPAAVPTIKTLVFGGEALSRQVLHAWLNHSVYLVNYWGPSECANSGCVNNSLTIDTDTLNIGRPSGHHVWITQRDNPDKLVPIGCVGELVVEGPMLSRGYINRPDQNAKSFVHDLAWSRASYDSSRRFYRTGDLARFNPDGTVTFAGRADNQVKIRGQRVELGEVEYNLRLCEPLFEQVIVEILTLITGEESQSLVAFIACRDSPKDQIGLIPASNVEFKDRLASARDALAQKLPRYMIPSIFMPVYKMPLTPSGKLDRRTLRGWIMELSPSDLSSYLVTDITVSQPLETEQEVLLQKSWSKVLNIDGSIIGGSDHFFRMGGDSVMAIMLVAALREASYHLTVADVFRYPELRHMARILTPSNISADLCTAPEPFSLIKDAKSIIPEIAQLCGVDAGTIEDIYPSTPMQEALMAVSAHQSAAYIQQEVYKLPASIDLDRLKSVWERLTSAQTILRTRIVNLNNAGSLQVVIKSEAEWQEHTSLESYLEDNKKTPMTHGGSLSRLAIIVSPTEDKTFVWTAHHAIYDGFSVAKLFEEMRYLYEGGRVRPMVSYNRFVRHIQSEVSADESSEFWKVQFPDTPKTYPDVPSTNYKPRPDQKWKSCVSAARKLGSSITTATVIQAAWALVTARHANADEALFGLTLSGRDSPMIGISDMVGPTITTIPLRINLDYTKTILEFLEGVQEQITLIQRHQHFGLQNIRQLSPEARSAVDFQNLLVVQPDEAIGFQATLDTMGMQRIDCLEGDFFNYPLVLECTVNASSIHIEALYDSKIISNEELACVMHQFEHVISQLMEQSDTDLVHNIDMVSQFDRNLLAKWTERQLPEIQATIHDSVRAQSLVRPNAIALSRLHEEWTYSQLEEATNKLAAHLINLGVGPEIRVVLCFTKSQWPIFAMLAVLKAGGVCVSTNPEHPKSRLLEICEDVQAPVVLCDIQGSSIFDGQVANIVAVDDDLFTRLDDASENSLTSVGSSNAAFIVYTSGTTGKPKGSVLEHRALVTSLVGIAEASGMDTASRTLQFSAYTFDAHILEIFGTLIAGGCVCVISESERMNMLEKVMAELSVNWSLLTPTVARLLTPQNLPTLKNLILSGEPLAQQDYRQWARHLQLWNGLGPSECSILACMTRLAVKEDGDPRNIGHPLNCNLWVTERHRPDRLVPIGCIGEMLVEGAIVGREYNNRPKATASAFISAPAWAKTDGDQRRFYRSGDLVKLNTDGSVIFIGRADTQVKIRGQRVEPAEVEKNVQNHLAEKGQVVVELIKPTNRTAGVMLMAFIAFDRASDTQSQSSTNSFDLLDTVSTRQLVTRLKSILPSHMIPSAYLVLDKLPVTPNGKMDRAALKKIASNVTVESLLAQHATATEIEMPSSGMEVKLARLWANVLDINVEVIGRTTSFLHLGGDSIKAMKLVATARKEALRLTIADIFMTPMLSEMAAAISILSEAEKTFVVEPFSTVRDTNTCDLLRKVVRPQLQESDQTIDDVSILTDFQASCVRSVLQKPRYRLLYVISPFSIDVDADKLLWACQQLVRRHDQLRTVFVADSDRQRHLQAVLRNPIVNIELLETNQNIMDFSKTLALNDINGDFVLGQPWARFWVVRDCSQKVCLVTRLCHAQYDGTSLPVLLQDLQDLLHDRQLTPVTPFTSYMCSVAEGSKEEGFKYWQELLSGATITPLPALGLGDSTESTEAEKAILHVEKCISMPRTPKDLTMSSMISAIYAMVISDFTRSNDIVFGQMMSGRNVPLVGVDEIMGACINMVPIRVRTSANNFTQLVRDLQSQKIMSTKYEFYHFSDTIKHLSNISEDTTMQWLVFHQNNSQITTTAFEADLYTPPVPAVIDDEITLVTDAHGEQLKVLLMGRRCRVGLMDAVMKRLESYLAAIRISGDEIELNLPLN